MIWLTALTVAGLAALGLWMLLDRNLKRVVLGIAVLGNAINLAVFAAGRLGAEQAAFTPAGQVPPAAANPLPQALILTAIVISFSFFAFLLVLVYRAYQDLGTDNGGEMRLAEPENDPLPPTGY